VPNCRLWKHEGIVWFSTSSKEPLTSLERHKCLDNCWMHVRMLFCEHVNMSRWTWTSEHEWIFFGILFDTWDKILCVVEEYFSMCSWMNDIYGWNGWTFSWMLATFFLKHLNERNRMEKKLVCFEILDTWNVEVILYISLIWSILSSA